MEGKEKLMLSNNRKVNLSGMIIMVAFVVILVVGVLGMEAMAANYPLEIINIRPAGTGSPAISSNNRIFKAYPGIEYNIRPAVFGGLYPYRFSLSSQPSGMIINENTGEISWPNPQTNSGEITLFITDLENTTINTTWSINVTTNGFLFVDDDYIGTESGTISQPYNSIQDLLDLDNSHANDIVYFRNGTYYVPAFHGTLTEGNPIYGAENGCALSYDGGRPYKWIGYPGETVEINQQDHFIQVFMPNGIYFDNLIFHNATAWGIVAHSATNYSTIRNCEFYDINSCCSSNANFGFIYFNGHYAGYYHTFQDNEFHDYAGAAGIGSLYDAVYTLIEDNEFYDQNQGIYSSLKCSIAAKSPLINLTIRHNNFHDINYGVTIGHTTNSMMSRAHDIEICYNLFDASSSNMAHNPFGYEPENGHSPTNIFYYRNTCIGNFIIDGLDIQDMNFHAYNNVIQNDDGGIYYYRSDVVKAIETDNLKGIPADNIVDASGNLTEAHSSYLGTHGWQIVYDDDSVFFSDSFENTEVNGGDNNPDYQDPVSNATWTGNNAYVAVVDNTLTSVTPHTGFKMLRFRYDNSLPEQRFNLGSNYTDDIYIRYYIYFPDGTESGLNRYIHKDTGSLGNNKAIRLWGDSYRDDGNKMGASFRVPTGTNAERVYLEAKLSSICNHGCPGGMGRVCTNGQSSDQWDMPSSDLGRWISFEFHFKQDTGAGDAKIEFWVDGEYQIGETNFSFDGSPCSPGYFRNGYLMGWANAIFDDETHVFIDDVVFATSYIGPIGGPDTTPPSRSNPSPTTELSAGTKNTTISLTTNESATCRYSTNPNTAYASMTNTFTTTGGTTHSTVITGLVDGQTYTYYVRAEDTAGNANTDDYVISFSVATQGSGDPGDDGDDDSSGGGCFIGTAAMGE